MELEERIKVLEDRIKNLEDIAHPPRIFVTCEECNTKIKEQR
tara:strand:- start:276 stop:401 length:126 start_codon:yes stop_codon:yes gene_type:complete